MHLLARSLLVGLGLGLALACSRAEIGTQAQPAEPGPGDAEPSFDQLRPHVGDPAPALSLETLDGTRVTLPMSKADRAAILIFGSFS